MSVFVRVGGEIIMVFVQSEKEKKAITNHDFSRDNYN
jgi:hypothetical protein